MASTNKNYQRGGGSGRETGTVSFTVKARTKGGLNAGTRSVHVRCDKSGNASGLCPWLRLQFAEIVKRVAKAKSDEEDRKRRK